MIESTCIAIHRQGTIAMTGRAHCQRQVAFFKYSRALGLAGVQGDPPRSFLQPPGSQNSKPHIKNREDHVTSPYNREVPHKFWCQSDV